MRRLRTALSALRGFARGFVGLATAAPVDASAARARICDAAEKRPHCC